MYWEQCFTLKVLQILSISMGFLLNPTFLHFRCVWKWLLEKYCHYFSFYDFAISISIKFFCQIAFFFYFQATVPRLPRLNPALKCPPPRPQRFYCDARKARLRVKKENSRTSKKSMEKQQECWWPYRASSRPPLLQQRLLRPAPNIVS